MVLLNAKPVLGKKIFEFPNFKLKGIDGKMSQSTDLIGEKGVLVAFICNHCPYVKGITRYLVEDSQSLSKIGIKTIAINSNDTVEYSEDSFENMIKFAAENSFEFPYLIDETQEIAKTFDAVCTPDFFLFTYRDNKLILSHKGRLNDFNYSKDNIQTFKPNRELLTIAQYLVGKSMNSMGCSIKWKNE